MGIATVKGLRDADPATIRRKFSVVLERTVLELRGVNCLALEEVAPDKQQIISSRSFGAPVLELEGLSDAVATYTCRAAEKLRYQRSVAGAVTVFIQTNPFKPEEPQYCPSMTIPLPAPTADSRVLVHWALRALERIFRSGYAYKKAGVMLAGIQPERIRQGTLFDDVESSERSGKVMAVMDSINEKWGRDVIKPYPASHLQGCLRSARRRRRSRQEHATRLQLCIAWLRDSSSAATEPLLNIAEEICNEKR